MAEDSPFQTLKPYSRNTALCAIVSILAVTLYATPLGWPTVIRVFGFTVVISLATFWLAGILGFIFGVPRTSETERANRSLQELTDWLTKLIIGASLAQLSEIVSGVASIGTMINATLQIPGGDVIFSALVVAEATAGFIFFYFWAYMYWDLLRTSAAGEHRPTTPTSAMPVVDSDPDLGRG